MYSSETCSEKFGGVPVVHDQDRKVVLVARRNRGVPRAHNLVKLASRQ